jgi:hypothetical protein
MHKLFLLFEKHLRESRHPLYVKIYERANLECRNSKRLPLILAAMEDKDEQVLSVFAEWFEQLRTNEVGMEYGCLFWPLPHEHHDGLKIDMVMNKTMPYNVNFTDR